jgi:hypothetical protein
VKKKVIRGLEYDIKVPVRQISSLSANKIQKKSWDILTIVEHSTEMFSVDKGKNVSKRF